MGINRSTKRHLKKLRGGLTDHQKQILKKTKKVKYSTGMKFIADTEWPPRPMSVVHFITEGNRQSRKALANDQ